MATNAEFAAVIGYLERERGVDRETILQAIEGSVEQAARKNTRVSADFTVRIDRKTLEIKAWDVYAVSDSERGFGILSVEQARRVAKDDSIQEGDTVKVPFPASKLGRIAAQTAKQTIMQKIRDAERNNVYNEYKDRVGDIVTGTVKMMARKDVYVELGKTEAVLPAKERLPGEDYSTGALVRAYVLRVQNETSGPAVTLSRACPEFVKALFRLEVSEVADGVVEVMAVARDPGRRSKVAVRSLDPRVDPLSACVGTKGVRVKGIVRELNNEKLDVVKWDPDPEIYARSALKPANPTTLQVDEKTHTIRATVPAADLSAAIGKGGQNVRLASQLTGWKISITADAPLEDEPGVPDEVIVGTGALDAVIRRLAHTLDVAEPVAAALVGKGFLSPEGIVAAERAYVQAQTDLDDETVRDIYERAQAIVDAKGE